MRKKSIGKGLSGGLSIPGGGGGGGSTWFQLCPVLCVFKSEGHGSFFSFKESENISLKMGVTFAASLNMGKNLC